MSAKFLGVIVSSPGGSLAYSCIPRVSASVVTWSFPQGVLVFVSSHGFSVRTLVIGFRVHSDPV